MDLHYAACQGTASTDESTEGHTAETGVRMGLWKVLE